MRIINLIVAAMLPVAAAAWNAHTVEEILDKSPEGKLARERYTAEYANIQTLNRLPDPEVEFEYKWGNKSEAGHKLDFGITQSFDWPGVYSARSREAEALRWVAYWSTAADYQNLRLRAIDLMVELTYQNRQLALLDSIAATYEDLHRAYQRGRESGHTTLLDLKKIELEQLNVRREVIEARNAREEALTALMAFCPDYDWASISTTTVYPNMEGPESGPSYSDESLETWLYYATKYDAMLQLNTAQELLANTRLEVEQRSSLPSWSLGYRYANEDGYSFNGVAVGVSVPLWSSRSKVKAAKAQLKADQLASDTERDLLVQRVKSQFARARQLNQDCEEYRATLYSSDLPRLLKMALDGGEMSLLDYLQESAYFLQAHQQLLTLERDLALTLCRLDAYIPL